MGNPQETKRIKKFVNQIELPLLIILSRILRDAFSQKRKYDTLWINFFVYVGSLNKKYLIGRRYSPA